MEEGVGFVLRRMLQFLGVSLSWLVPVPVTKFEGDKSNHFGQLFVTLEMIAKKIKKMKDNKSPGVDGKPPKLLKEIEQISAPLAKVFNLSLEHGILPS